MFTGALRRSGGLMNVAIPQAYIEQNHLGAGSRAALKIAGDELKLKPTWQRQTLGELLASTLTLAKRVQG